MRWVRLSGVVASIGLGGWALGGTGGAQIPRPPAAAPATESADALNAEVIRLYRAGKYAEAIPLARRVLALHEKALGPDHPNVGTSLNTWPGCTRARAATPRPSRSISAACAARM